MRPAAAVRAPRLGVHGVVTVTIVLVLIGYLFAANARLAGAGTGRSPQDLPSLVQTEADRAQSLGDEVEALRAEVDQLTAAMSEDVAGPEDPLATLAAGGVAVEGPGLTVSLSDAPAGAPRPDWATNDDLVVHQQDMQAVINALWAGGAEAMMLQDQRVVATTAFRCVGPVLLLHSRVYSPPYVVRAIGDPEALRAALEESAAVQEYQAYADVLRLGWSVSQEDRMTLPAYEGGLELEHATVPEGFGPEVAQT